MVSRKYLRLLFGLALIFCTLNLSFQCWSTTLVSPEISEEIEQVLEDDFPIEAIFSQDSMNHSNAADIIPMSATLLSESGYQASHFFEINSPPPEQPIA